MPQDNHIAHIIRQLGELRELLLVIDQSGTTIPSILLKLAKEKAESIATATQQLRTPEFWVELERHDAFESDTLMETEIPTPYIEEETVIEENTVTEIIDSKEDTPAEEIPADSPLQEEAPLEDETKENEGEAIEEADLYPWEQLNTEEQQAVQEEDIEDEEECDDLENDLYDDTEEEYDDTQEEHDDNDTPPSPVTLEEALQRKQAKELRKALSLNDRFRFRRELFGNSDIRMNETLALIDAMSSFEEAEEYIFDDLGWDIENPDVAEFMKIVQNHFL